MFLPANSFYFEMLLVREPLLIQKGAQTFLSVWGWYRESPQTGMSVLPVNMLVLNQ